MKYTLCLALAGMACSCNPVLRLETSAYHRSNKDSGVSHPPMADDALFDPPKTDSSGYVLLPSTDRTVITAEPIGNLSYQQQEAPYPGVMTG